MRLRKTSLFFLSRPQEVEAEKEDCADKYGLFLSHQRKQIFYAKEIYTVIGVGVKQIFGKSCHRIEKGGKFCYFKW